jgi:hypothetical protein
MPEQILTEIRGNPPTQPIRHYRGDTFKKLYRFRNADGTPKDLSSSSFEFQVRRSRKQKSGLPLMVADEFFTSQSADAIAANETFDDQVEVVISAENTEVQAGEWVYDFRRTDNDVRTTKVTGPFILADDVSQLP